MKLFDTCEYNAPNFSQFLISEMQYYSGINIDANGMITGFRNSGPRFLEFKIKSPNFNELFQNVSYNKQITFNVVKNDYLKRNESRFLRDKRFCLVFEDKNGLFWFVSNLKNINYESRINESENNILLTLQTNEKSPFRQIETTFAATLVPYSNVCFTISEPALPHLNDYAIYQINCLA